MALSYSGVSFASETQSSQLLFKSPIESATSRDRRLNTCGKPRISRNWFLLGNLHNTSGGRTGGCMALSYSRVSFASETQSSQLLFKSPIESATSRDRRLKTCGKPIISRKLFSLGNLPKTPDGRTGGVWLSHTLVCLSHRKRNRLNCCSNRQSKVPLLETDH